MRYVIDIDRGSNGSVHGAVIREVMDAPALFEGWHELLAILGDEGIDEDQRNQRRRDSNAGPDEEERR